MSNALNAVVPSSFEGASATLIAATGTAAKVLIDTYASAASGVTTPAYYGGCSIIDITAVSTDTAAKNIVLHHGTVLTNAGAVTGAMTMTASGIARAIGSFIADGWMLGDLVMCFAAKGTASNTNDGVLGIVTGVTAATLAVNGTPFAVIALNAGTRVCRMAPLLRASIEIGAGTNGVAPSIGLLNHVNDGSVMRYERKLGTNELLTINVAAAVSALPAAISVYAQLARY